MVSEIFLLPPRHSTHLRPFFSHLPFPLPLSLSLFLSHSLPPFVFYHEFHPRDISLPRHVQLATQRSVVSLCSTLPLPSSSFFFVPFLLCLQTCYYHRPFSSSCISSRAPSSHHPLRDISSSGSPRGLSQGRTRIYLPTGSPTTSRNRYISSKPIVFSFFFALRTRAIYAPRVILFRPSGARYPVCSSSLWVKVPFLWEKQIGSEYCKEYFETMSGVVLKGTEVTYEGIF